MSGTQKDPNVHKVKIQQTYWVKDTSEEKILEMGAIRSSKVVEQVDYYDTDLYDLALNETWLSKRERDWQLIVGKSGQERPTAPDKNNHNPPKKSFETSHKQTQNVNSVDIKTGISPTMSTSTTNINEEASMTDLNGNTNLVDQDGTSRNPLTCYALVGEKEIIAYLSRILHIAGETENMDMGDVLQMARIQKYASVSHSTQETFRLRDSYTVHLKANETSAKKSAVISLDVEIENVTHGFQRLEQLANELDLQLQNV